MQKTICVDFDGVIADYTDGFKGRDVFGEVLHGAGSSMAALKDDGWKIIIFTSRPDTPALRAYLKENAIPYDEINKNSDQPDGCNPGKPVADLYLDDRAFRFQGWADFRYALDAMVKDKILESAVSGDWQTLKLLFEKPKAPFIMEGAITPDDDLLNEWWGKVWPQYEDEGYSKDEIRGYILSGNWDADHLRNDIAEHDAKYDDGPGIVLADSAAEAALLNAIANIKHAKNLPDMLAWFASAFDIGPAGKFPGLSDAARNIDAIWRLAAKLNGLRAVHDDASADIEDRLEATREFNDIVSYSVIKLDDGSHTNTYTLEGVSGVNTVTLKSPISVSDYSDMKLTQYRDEAQNVCARAGVAPMAAIQRIKNANAEITRATEELNTKSSPICAAYQLRLEAALLKNGYAGKKLETVDLANKYQALRNELNKEKPADYSYSRDHFQTQAEYIQKYEAWAAKIQGLWDEQQDAIKAVRAEMQTLYDAAQVEAGDLNAEVAPLHEEYKAITEAQKGEIAAARAEIGKIKDHVLAASPISKEAADKWFDDMVLVTKSMQTNLKKRGYDMATLKQTMTEFHRMTGGRLPRISFETKGGGRAAAQPGTGVVYVAGTFGKATFFHEMAHILEDDERTRAISNRFIDQRTGRVENRTLVKLSKLTGNSRYGANELAYPDSFIDPYVGKYYRDGATEVFSMGMQYFNSPEAMVTLLEKDPDHFNFMLGYMATPPRLNKGKIAEQQAAMAEKKDAVQTSEEFLKALDKKIAKAGDFWSREGLVIDSSYGRNVRASWPSPDREGYRRESYSVTEKNLKRAMWLYIAAGKPEEGQYSMRQLTGYVFGKKVNIPKEIAKNQALLEGPA